MATTRRLGLTDEEAREAGLRWDNVRNTWVPVGSNQYGMTAEHALALGYPATAFGPGGIMQMTGYDINALNQIIQAQSAANFAADYSPGGAYYRPTPTATASTPATTSTSPTLTGGASQLKPATIVGTDVTNPQGNWFGELKDIAKGASSGASAGALLGPVGALAGAIVGGVVNSLIGPNRLPGAQTVPDTGSAARLAGPAGMGGAAQLSPVVEVGTDQFWGPLESVDASSLAGKNLSPIITPEIAAEEKAEVQKALEAGPVVTRDTEPIVPDLAAGLAGPAGIGGASQLKPVEVVNPMDYFGKGLDFNIPPYNYVPTIIPPTPPATPAEPPPERIPGVVTPAEKRSGKGKVTPADVRHRVNRRSLFYGGGSGAGDVYIPTLIGY